MASVSCNAMKEAMEVPHDGESQHLMERPHLDSGNPRSDDEKPEIPNRADEDEISFYTPEEEQLIRDICTVEVSILDYAHLFSVQCSKLDKMLADEQSPDIEVPESFEQDLENETWQTRELEGTVLSYLCVYNRLLKTVDVQTFERIKPRMILPDIPETHYLNVWTRLEDPGCNWTDYVLFPDEEWLSDDEEDVDDNTDGLPKLNEKMEYDSLESQESTATRTATSTIVPAGINTTTHVAPSPPSSSQETQLLAPGARSGVFRAHQVVLFFAIFQKITKKLLGKALLSLWKSKKGKVAADKQKNVASDGGQGEQAEE